MSEIRQGEIPDGTTATNGEKILAVRTSPSEIRYLTPRELADSITQEDIQRGLDLAGAWSELNLSEEELFEALGKIRYGSDPISPIRPQ